MRQGLLVSTHEFGHADENSFDKKRKGEMNPRNRVREEEARGIVLQVAR